jgi:hypothetical protein
MLIPMRVIPGIEDGSVTLAFRRWRKPAATPGGRQRTPAGELAIDAVDPVAVEDITEDEARRAGHRDLADLRAELARHPDGTLYRIAFHRVGDDPRVSLREQADLGRDELEAVAARLDRIDRSRRSGPWTEAVLALIEQRPAVRAPELALNLGRETLAFKRDVRTLKELGLTESLDTGYRLSPRGRVVLAYLRDRVSDRT